MSYASIAAKNAPPEEEQPKPSQDLLEGGHFSGETEAHKVLDDSSKVEVVERSWLEHPETATSTGESNTLHADPLTVRPPDTTNDPNLSTSPSTSSVAPTPLPKPTRAEAGPESKMADRSPASKSYNPADPSADLTAPPKGSEIDVREKKEQAKAQAKKGVEEVKQGAEDVKRSAERKAEEIKEELPENAEEAGAELGKKVDQGARKAKQLADDAEKKAKQLKDEASAEIQKAENAMSKYYAQAKEVVLRPGTLGGIMGIANVGLLSTLGYYAYTRRNIPWNRNYVGAAVASVVSLFGVEGIVADQYASTPTGREEIERAKLEGSRAYNNIREVVLRPGVAGGLLGVVNVAVLGAVGYLGYQEWDRPVWDRKLVAGITCGLISLSAVEGLATSTYRQKELPRQKRKGNA